MKMVLAAGRAPATGDALDVVSLLLDYASEMEPPAGAAPAGYLYKRNPQAAARRRNRCAGLVVPLPGSGAISPGPEHGAFLLFVKPAKELLKAFVGQDSLDGIEHVAQFVMRPGFVNEIFARMAGRHCFASAFAARDDVMPAGAHIALTEYAAFHITEFKPRMNTDGHGFPETGTRVR